MIDGGQEVKVRTSERLILHHAIKVWKFEATAPFVPVIYAPFPLTVSARVVIYGFSFLRLLE